MSTKKKRVGKLTNPVSEVVRIDAPNFKETSFKIRGTTPYVQHKFSAKAIKEMIYEQEKGSTGKKGKKRKPKDFDANYRDATHGTGKKGEFGIPAAAFRNAMISACKIVGFHMTKGKLAVFVKPDLIDDEETQLVQITKGKPKRFDLHVRNKTGVIDIRARPKWKAGWEATVRVWFDADVFTLTDITNLLMRVGMQVGIGEGRPDSKDSCGMGWGLFELVLDKRSSR